MKTHTTGRVTGMGDGNFYDPIEGLETRPEKTQQGYWRLEGRNDEWLDEIERPERTLEVRAQAKA